MGVGVTAFGFELKESGKIKVVRTSGSKDAFAKDISACGGKVYAGREPLPLHTQERVYVERVHRCALKESEKFSSDNSWIGRAEDITYSLLYVRYKLRYKRRGRASG